MREKPLFWIASSREDLRHFPASVRRKAGFELRAVQRGEKPTDFKPMPGVGAGVGEIRIRIGEIFRVFYVARFKEAVYVLHAFQKKSQKTSQRDLRLGQERYRQMILYRDREQGNHV